MSVQPFTLRIENTNQSAVCVKDIKPHLETCMRSAEKHGLQAAYFGCNQLICRGTHIEILIV